MIHIYLAIIILLLGSCDENSNKDSADTDNDYSLTLSDTPETLDDGTLSDVKVTLKQGDDTVDSGALAEASITMAISCTTDNKDEVSINKVVDAEDGVADFGDIKISEGICKTGEYKCSLTVSLKINDEEIEDRTNFNVDIKEPSANCPTNDTQDKDTEVPPSAIEKVGAGKLFEITGGGEGDSVALRKKAGATGHCNALLLQEVYTNGALTGIKELGIVVASDGNAQKLFIVGTVDNCELYVGQTKINKQFTSTAENTGSSISVKETGNTHVKVKLGNDPNGSADDPQVTALFISQGVSTALPVTNPSWSKQWHKANTAGLSYGNDLADSSVEWQENMTTAMAVIKVGDSWQTISLIVPSATFWIKGTMTAGSEFTVEGRDGGVLSLADKGGSCGAGLYQLEQNALPHILRSGDGIVMRANNQASNLIIAGNTSNCQLMVGPEKVAGTLVAMQSKDDASIVAKSTKNSVITVILGDDPMTTSTISEMFVQVGTKASWGRITDGMRTANPDENRIPPWGLIANENNKTYSVWGSNTRVRAFFRASKGESHKWYSINY